VIAYEEPPVVELEELLDDQEEAEAARTGRQIALVVLLSIVGLAGVSVLAAMLVPVAAEAVRWIVFTIRFAQGS
jgi:hypothetical protein